MRNEAPRVCGHAYMSQSRGQAEADPFDAWDLGAAERWCVWRGAVGKRERRWQVLELLLPGTNCLCPSPFPFLQSGALSSSIGQPGVAASTLSKQESRGLRTVGSYVIVHLSISVCPLVMTLGLFFISEISSGPG